MQKKLLILGAEKICIQSCGIENKEIIKEIISHFGSQSFSFIYRFKKNIFGKLKLWNYLKNDFYKEIMFMILLKKCN